MIITIDTESKEAKLAVKWRYNPLRRFENTAGDEPMTEKQAAFVSSLAQKRPTDFKELVSVVVVIGGVTMDEWTKADAMFVINALAPKKTAYKKWVPSATFDD